jgi:chorismate mutase
LDDIKQLRKRIDEVDEQILLSLSQRTELCKSIGSMKKKQGIQIKDPLREKDVYTHIKKKAADSGLNPAQVEAIYHQIVKMCTSVQDLEEKSE